MEIYALAGSGILEDEMLGLLDPLREHEADEDVSGLCYFDASGDDSCSPLGAAIGFCPFEIGL